MNGINIFEDKFIADFFNGMLYLINKEGPLGSYNTVNTKHFV